ncbi:MAG: tRNA 2-thiouridine(34) synthase MnmA [Kiritimatiellae bacterium]|nr:tRNA 2-thiouridine(34) synthase MnmA [Kiritimatiellia bacterium]
MTIAVGLSGGVDSSVSALMLKNQGHNVVGITMKLWRGQYRGGDKEACFGAHEAEHIAAAEAFAKSIGIEYRVFDCSEEYDKTIISYFRDTYLSGRTPNPCVYCNAIMKFGLLPRLAIEGGLKFDKFATGHYARVVEEDGRYKLLRAVDEAKDQSYFLYRLSQEQLKRHIFPLGDLTKIEARNIAREYNLIAADRPDSQDFYSGDTAELIGEGERIGDIINLDGKKVGSHTGFWKYTIGQRKGLGIGGAGEPYYVVDIDAANNRVIVGRINDAVKPSLKLTDINWVSIAPTDDEIPCRVKVRSASRLVDAVYRKGECFFEKGVFGVAPGQSAVVYSATSEELLLGGIIE